MQPVSPSMLTPPFHSLFLKWLDSQAGWQRERLLPAAFLPHRHSRLQLTPCAARLACFQPEATLQAAAISDAGARYAGDRTFKAAIIALIGSLLLVIGAFGQTRYAAHVERRERKKRYENAFRAEIESVLTFLHSVGVVGTLRKQVAAETREPFHPGDPDNWLRVYYKNPDSVGLFPNEISRELVWFYARMFAQFGRLLYIHNLGAKGVDSVGIKAVNKIQGEIADTLDDLDRRGWTLVTQLGGPREAARATTDNNTSEPANPIDVIPTSPAPP